MIDLGLWHQKGSNLQLSKRIAVTLCAAMCTLSINVHATVQNRPVIQGYALSIYLFPDATAMGRYWCETGSGAALRFDHIEQVYAPSATEPNPPVFIWCKWPSGSLQRTNSSFLWLKGCPDSRNLYPYTSWPESSSRACTEPVDKPPRSCGNFDSPGHPAYGHGNPINMSAQEKIQVENDYISRLELRFSRYYSSLKQLPIGGEGMSQGWRHTYSKRLVSTKTQGGSSSFTPVIDRYQWGQRSWLPYTGGVLPASQDFAFITRPDGYSHYFVSSDHGMTWQADSDVSYKLSSSQMDGNGNVLQWQLITPQNDIETYDQAGRLISIRFKSGRSLILTYSDASTLSSIASQTDLLIQVADDFGRTLHFRYDSQSRLTEMSDPAGQVYKYTYVPSTSNLSSVTYPNGLSRTYLYNEAAYQANASNPAYNYLLTGIADEVSPSKSVRYATFMYDDSGRPISTEHAGAVNKYVFNYTYNRITDPVGTSRTYTYQKFNGVPLQTGVSQPAGAGCSASSNTNTYDANGNVASSIDFGGNQVCYAFDLTRNLETVRVEGLASNVSCATMLSATSLTAPARRITTQWHASYRLPTLIAEPKKLTTFSYDGSGNLLSKVEQATTDATGAQGAAATATGVARTWNYTYNQYGQVLTATDPLNNTTGYAYDGQGNLASVTNAAGQVTSLSNYDANGRVGRITDANGVNTDLTYSPRGWLTARTVAGETTGYDYDGVGQLKKVTLPDGSSIAYTYDDAHRLTDIADSAGNSIHYTLDNMGNRIREEAKDASGTLARQTTRVYDALNRLQQITGASL